LTDAQQYDDTQLRAPIPTLILHGRQDEVIAIEASQQYASTVPGSPCKPSTPIMA
jgi:pimeloyl-ACP methyl ester carboxylesterase